MRSGWIGPQDCRLADFAALVEQPTDPADYPYATGIENGVLVYGPDLADTVADPHARRAVQAELSRALLDGPGVLVLAGAFDPDTVDAATKVFTRLLDEQAAAGGAVGDHFAKPGTNGRLWCALDKLAAADPEVFAAYYANDLLAMASEAWLGPGYQVTSQVNVVYPGGVAQVPHRDYHLGFMDTAQAQAFPAPAHALSPALTLQGAIAHVDMPVESGPTFLLPNSQKYVPGYVAWHLPEFQQYAVEHCVQLPLAKGDAVFLNPALFHGAGTNRTAGIARMANLLQVSSAFGRAMEAVDTTAISMAVYPVLQQWVAAGVEPRLIANVVSTAAEGYPFPTNLDLDPPVGSMAPPSQAALVAEALQQGWDQARLAIALEEQGRRRRPPGP